MRKESKDTQQPSIEPPRIEYQDIRLVDSWTAPFVSHLSSGRHWLDGASASAKSALSFLVWSMPIFPLKVLHRSENAQLALTSVNSSEPHSPLGPRTHFKQPNDLHVLDREFSDEPMRTEFVQLPRSSSIWHNPVHIRLLKDTFT
ncbi:hypothetical protein JAAARDRAFT_43175 [Jaapia argillacea MUCL 33604]|uniref:Uncharacterized protein n=1 Tax=Jaapia argillacea MUCL 33604 TaxID=933084 RepID=A0A067P4W7_9AGAM|nr:hypothetical protein JAAARDRAFT_43175 [Jaapia argillacea MUCL 33604]